MEAEIKMNLPIKLASLRKQNGLTQLELAEKLNVSRQAISRWEVGTAVPSTDNLRVLSNLYGVSVDYLLNDNADDSYKNSENLEQKPEEQEWTQRRIIRYVLAYAVALIMVYRHHNLCDDDSWPKGGAGAGYTDRRNGQYS